MLALAALAVPGRAREAIREALIFDDGRPHAVFDDESDPSLIYRSWPFCPTDRMPCGESELAWVNLKLSIDVYSLRRNDPHDSIKRIIDTTRSDLAPLVSALRSHFDARGVTSDVERVAFVHGLVQATSYEADVDTGWTEYPKFGIEFLVDEQGDCDDAAVTNAVILDALGYASYFVRWRGPGEGHLSTAIPTTRGDLRGFGPPSGSRWIEAAGAPRLLQVDATGTPGGCGRSRINCAPLGFNRWHEQGLRVVAVARADDPDIQTILPLSAWNNGGLSRPDRQLVDRRSASDAEIREEVLDPRSRQSRLRDRLTGLDVSERTARVYLRRQRPYSREAFLLFVGLSLGVMSWLAVVAWRRRVLRLRRVADAGERKRAAEF